MSSVDLVIRVISQYLPGNHNQLLSTALGIFYINLFKKIVSRETQIIRKISNTFFKIGKYKIQI